MKKDEFLKIVQSIFKSCGFSKKGNNYYFDFNNDFLGVFGLQKSTYDAYYYIEFGFAIKSLNPKMPFPKYYELNLNFGRINFEFCQDSNAVYYEEIDEEAFKGILQEKIAWFIEIGKLGKNSIEKNFYEFGSHAIGGYSLIYLGLPLGSKPTLSEACWQ